MAKQNNNTDAIESRSTTSDTVKVTSSSIKFGPLQITRGAILPSADEGRNGDLFLLDDTALSDADLQSNLIPSNVALYQKKPMQVSSGPVEYRSIGGGLNANSGDSITVNGTQVIFSGGSLQSVADDIAMITGLAVDAVPNSLMGSTDAMPMSPDSLGINVGGAGMVPVVFSTPFTVEHAVTQIKAAGISDLIVNTVNGALTLTVLDGSEIVLTNLAGNPIANLGPFTQTGGALKFREETGAVGLMFSTPIGTSATTLFSRLVNQPPSPTVLGGGWEDISSGAGSPSSSSAITDADGDTFIDVERTADDDTLRLSVGDNTNDRNGTDLISINVANVSIAGASALNPSVAGGNVSITGGAGDPANFGGSVSIRGGDNGGFLQMSGGSANAGSDFRGGNVLFAAGNGDGTGIPGFVRFFPGAAGATSSSPDGEIQVFPVSGGGNPAKFRWYTNGATAGVSLEAPIGMTTNVDYVLPGVDGTVGQRLITDGSGVLSWADAGSGGKIISGTRASPILINTTGVGGGFSGENVIFLQSAGGAVTVTALTQITAGTNIGDEIILIGRSDTDTLTFSDGNGLSLNGNVTLGEDDVLSLMWDGTNWVEISRNL